jgi:hypothetical protein
MISDLTSRQILDAIDRALEEIAQRFAKDAPKSTPLSQAHGVSAASDGDDHGEGFPPAEIRGVEP